MISSLWSTQDCEILLPYISKQFSQSAAQPQIIPATFRVLFGNGAPVFVWGRTRGSGPGVSSGSARQTPVTGNRVVKVVEVGSLGESFLLKLFLKILDAHMDRKQQNTNTIEHAIRCCDIGGFGV